MINESHRFFKTIHDFLVVYLPRQRGASPNTVTSYKQALRMYLSFLTESLGVRYDSVTFDDWNGSNINLFLQELESKRKVSAATRNQRLFAIRSFLKYARIDNPEEGIISMEVMSITKAREEKVPVSFLSEKATEALLAAPGTRTRIGIRDTCFLVLMYDAAARDCEMLSLKVNSFALGNKTPTVRLYGKGSKIRYVPLMKKTVEHICRYRELYHNQSDTTGDELFFYTTAHGERHQMSDDNVARFFDKYAKIAHADCSEVPEHVTPHQLRHTRAMHLYRNGMPLQLLSEFMGHSSTISTQIYAYADTEMKRAAIEKSRPDIALPEDTDLKPLWQTDEEMINRLYGLS